MFLSIIIFSHYTFYLCSIGKLLVFFFFFLPSFNYCLRATCEACEINSLNSKDSWPVHAIEEKKGGRRKAQVSNFQYRFWCLVVYGFLVSKSMGLVLNSRLHPRGQGERERDSWWKSQFATKRQVCESIKSTCQWKWSTFKVGAFFCYFHVMWRFLSMLIVF